MSVRHFQLSVGKLLQRGDHTVHREGDPPQFVLRMAVGEFGNVATNKPVGASLDGFQRAQDGQQHAAEEIEHQKNSHARCAKAKEKISLQAMDAFDKQGVQLAERGVEESVERIDGLCPSVEILLGSRQQLAAQKPDCLFAFEICGGVEGILFLRLQRFEDCRVGLRCVP